MRVQSIPVSLSVSRRYAFLNVRLSDLICDLQSGLCSHFIPAPFTWCTDQSYPDQDVAQPALHGQSGRDPVVNALGVDGLVDTGSPPLLAPARDPLSLRQLYRSVPIM